MIQVRLFEMDQSVQEEYDYEYQAPRRPNMISEKVVKGQAISHSLDYGAAHKAETPEKEFVDKFSDDSEQPFAVYSFLYRSRGKRMGDCGLDCGIRLSLVLLH
jgi:hypothetical protein